MRQLQLTTDPQNVRTLKIPLTKMHCKVCGKRRNKRDKEHAQRQRGKSVRDKKNTQDSENRDAHDNPALAPR